MSKITRNEIVRPEEILSQQEVLDARINEAYLDNVFENPDSTNRWLAKHRLIPNERECMLCHNNVKMSYIKNNKKIDGFQWTCKRPCKNVCSIKKDSFFFGSKLELKTLLKIIYKYVNGDEFLDIAYELSIDRDTASSWADLTREAICCYLQEHSILIGGVNSDGSSKIVEIDESLFTKQKYNRGRLLHNQWYVGGIERGSRNCFIVPVENRSAVSIAAVIYANVNPGTLVMTDQWRAYGRALSDLGGFEHATVNHSIYFVDPFNPEIHTQNIEGLWSRSKYFIRKKRGIAMEKQSEYLIQFLWEYGVEKRKRFNTLLTMLNWCVN